MLATHLTATARTVDAMSESGTPGATETAERCRHRSTAEWEELADSTDQLHRDLAVAMIAGVRPGCPGSAEASALAARLREIIEEDARAHGVDPGTASWD